MFASLLVIELKKHLGEKVEIALDERFIEGTLFSISNDLVVVSDTFGYYPGDKLNITVQSINSVRVLND